MVPSFVAASMPPGKGTPLAQAKQIAAYMHGAFYSPLAQERNRPPRVEMARLTVRQFKNAVADLVSGTAPVLPENAEKGLRGQYFKARDFDELMRMQTRNFAERRHVLASLEAGVGAVVSGGWADAARIGITGLSDGAATVQFALQRGARVVVTASEANAERLRGYGAEVTPYGDGLAERVAALAGTGSHPPVDRVFDMSPGGALEEYLADRAARVVAVDDRDGPAGPECRGERSGDRLRDGAQLLPLPRQPTQRRQALGQAIRIAVEAQGRFQGCEQLMVPRKLGGVDECPVEIAHAGFPVIAWSMR